MTITRIRTVTRDLHGRLRRFFDTPLEPGATPLEICQAVLDEVERRVEPVGRGRRVFPYTALHVRVLAPDDARAPFEAAFTGFPVRVAERLAEVRCETPARIDVTVVCEPDAPWHWPPGQVYEVRYERDATAATARPAAVAPPESKPPALRVTVLKGEAAEPSCVFTQSTIAIGRMSDPTDDLGRVRRNRIAFTDAVDGVTETVGRAHARLRFDAEAGAYRLYDEGSRNGTAIVRDGEVIPVARRDPRGVRIRSGDEIQVGRALLRVELGD